MDYIRTEADGQLTLTQSTEFLLLPSCLYGFNNTETTVETARSGRLVYCHKGNLELPEQERLCSCGRRMHINSHPDISLFKTEDIKRKAGYEAKYDALLNENKLLFTLDLIKEKLSAAYALTDEIRIRRIIYRLP